MNELIKDLFAQNRLSFGPYTLISWPYILVLYPDWWRPRNWEMGWWRNTAVCVVLFAKFKGP